MRGGYSIDEGRVLVKAARHSIELYLKATKFDRKILERAFADINGHHGINVTIRHYPLGELRGSVGMLKGAKLARNLLIDAALEAAEDKRFVALSHHELEHVIFEVSVLSNPTTIKKGTLESMKRQIKLGKHGIMVEYGYRNGMLLPNEIKKGAKVDKLLEEVCLRAGLDAHDYKRHDIVFHTFTAQTFRETEPDGGVEEVSQ